MKKWMKILISIGVVAALGAALYFLLPRVEFPEDAEVYVSSPLSEGSYRLPREAADEVMDFFAAYSFAWQKGTFDCLPDLSLSIGEDVIQLHGDHCNLVTRKLSLSFRDGDGEWLYDFLADYPYLSSTDSAS